MRLWNREYYEKKMKKIANGENNSIVLQSLENPLICMGFSGKADKPRFNYRFMNDIQRDKYIKEFIEGEKKRLEEKAKEKLEVKNKTHSAKVGDIFYRSWGYEQTNIDFYEVVEVVSNKSVRLREINATVVETGFMSGISEPLKGNFEKDSKIFLSIVNKYGGFNYEGYILSKHKEGQKHYCSWYA